MERLKNIPSEPSESERRNYADYGENELQEVFIIVHDVSSKINLIGRFGVMQSDVHSRMGWDFGYSVRVRIRSDRVRVFRINEFYTQWVLSKFRFGFRIGYYRFRVGSGTETEPNRSISGETKVSTLRNGGDDAVAEAPPWNLRTRRAACNEPGDEPTRITGVKRGSNEGGGDGDSQKLKFSVSFVSLLRELVEKDFTAFDGKKPPTRPKKRQEIFRVK
ncbi:unnamed protein product [Brassica oleracea]